MAFVICSNGAAQWCADPKLLYTDIVAAFCAINERSVHSFFNYLLTKAFWKHNSVHTGNRWPVSNA